MSTDREVNEILAEIGREHRAINAPERLQPVLCAAVAERKRPQTTSGAQRAWAWAVAVILLAAIVGVSVLWQTRISHRAQAQQAGSMPKARQSAAPTQASTSEEIQRVPLKTAQLHSTARKHAAIREASSRQRASNSLDEFVPLPVSEGLPTSAELRVVRMKLRGSDLQQYGLQTPVDAAGQTMLAEFAVGEDGLPRAIRILR